MALYKSVYYYYYYYYQMNRVNSCSDFGYDDSSINIVVIIIISIIITTRSDAFPDRQTLFIRFESKIAYCSFS